MTKRAAAQIVFAMSAFEKEPDHIRQQAEQIIMQRVQRMRGGTNEIIDGDDLIKEFVEPTPEPEPEPEIIVQENPEVDAPVA